MPPFTLALVPKQGAPRDGAAPRDGGGGGGGAGSWVPQRAAAAELSWYLRFVNAEARDTWEARLHMHMRGTCTANTRHMHGTRMRHMHGTCTARARHMRGAPTCRL